jgi:thioredoxin-like negative regulator of GroEL
MQVLIYTSPTCGPCKTLKPILFELAEQKDFNCIAVEASPATQKEFLDLGIRTVPTVLVLDDDHKEVSRFSGAKSKAELETWLAGRWVF